MTSIGGDSVSRVTIDGEEVREITVGGDTVFTYPPEDDLVAWYDFNEAITSGQYTPDDKSGNGNTLNGPNLDPDTNQTTINGRAATRLPNSDSDFFTDSVSLQDPHAFIFVMELDPSLDSDRNEGDGYRFFSSSVDNFDQPDFSEYDSFELFNAFKPSGAVDTDIGFGNDVVVSGRIFTVYVDSSDPRIRIDGQEITQLSTRTPIEDTVDYLSLGGISQVPGGGFGGGFVGAFGEFVLLNGTADVSAWEDFLMGKWGL